MMVVDMHELCKNGYNIILYVQASYILLAVLNNSNLVYGYSVHHVLAFHSGLFV